MKFNNDYILREIAGETILVKQGVAGVDMTHVIGLNVSGAFLFQKFQHSDFSASDIADALAREYGIDRTTALNDVSEWLKTLSQHNAVSL